MDVLIVLHQPQPNAQLCEVAGSCQGTNIQCTAWLSTRQGSGAQHKAPQLLQTRQNRHARWWGIAVENVQVCEGCQRLHQCCVEDADTPN